MPQIYVDVLPVISTFLPDNKEFSALTNIKFVKQVLVYWSKWISCLFCDKTLVFKTGVSFI